MESLPSQMTMPMHHDRSRTSAAAATSSSSSSLRTRGSLSVATRSMAARRSAALGERRDNMSATETIPRTMKRKEADMEAESDCRKKMRRETDENERMVMLETPVTPPSTSMQHVDPATPVTRTDANDDIASVPTPAREILRAGYDNEAALESVVGNGHIVTRPPTPPRMKPRRSHQQLSSASGDVLLRPGKRVHSPDHRSDIAFKRAHTSIFPAPHPRLSSPSNFGFAHAISPRPSSLKSEPQENADGSISDTHAPRTRLSDPIPTLHGHALNTQRSEPTTRLRAISGSSRLAPTVPMPFSFSTARPNPTSAPAPPNPPASLTQSGVPDQLAVGTSQAGSDHPVRDVKGLPKASTMGPPSRLPLKTTKPSTGLSTASSSTSATAAAPKPKPKPQLGIADRRPVKRVPSGTTVSSSTKSLAVLDESSVPATENAPVRRKPSYGSGLGSGPLAQPRARTVSGPVQVPRTSLDTWLSSANDMDVDSRPGPSTAVATTTPRSVSDPLARPRPSLTMSTRREGFADTSKSLAGLTDALAKLKMKRDDLNDKPIPANISRPPKSMPVLGEVQGSGLDKNVVRGKSSLSAPSRLSGIQAPRASILGADVSMSGLSSSLLGTDTGKNSGSDSATTILRGVVAYVDVRTDDGASSGEIWASMLKSLGAKVNVRLTTAVTHIIFKAGSNNTLNWYRRQEQDEKPYLVGVGWLLKSKRGNERLDEAEFTVDIAVADIFQKRRKSMEPKSLAASSSNNPAPSGLRGAVMTLAARQSLQYAPKISSPLKRAVMTREESDVDM